jgi:ABC-type nickel/cobalt efflux system permease component RcnA
MRRLALILAVLALAALAWAIADNAAWTQAVAWMLEQQRLFHRQLAEHMRALEGGGTAAAAWALVAASFLYGVFHAAGPGHGKAVIATYLLTHESRLARGVWLAAASSLCQGAVAVALVTGLVMVAGWLPRETQDAVTWSERLSFALLAAMGALFALRALRALAAVRHHDHHGHHHHHHDHGPGCGCSHTPSPHQIERAGGLQATLGVLLSVGLRPCSGAVLVLAAANVLDLVGAGIAAVAAMSAGTAITVAALAMMTVKARHWAARLSGGDVKGRVWLGSLVALAGGVAIFLLAASLLVGSFAPAHPLRM